MTLDHAYVMVTVLMTVFVLFAVVMVCRILDDPLTFDVGVVDDWWHIETSRVEHTVYLIFP